MRTKKLLAAFLLGVGLCFVPVSGYGKVEHWMDEAKASLMSVKLLEARLEYMMSKPDNFLWVRFSYDPDGHVGRKYFPRILDTEGKIWVMVKDSRRVFYYKSGGALLDQFKKELETIYWFIELIATDMNTDIVATFQSAENVSLGYFYQGKYHLWER